MVLGLGFAVLAAAAFVQAALAGNVVTTVLCGAYGAGLLGAAAAWMGGGPRLFGKRADGTMPLWAWGLHASWYTLALVAFYGRLWWSREPACDEVAAGVWVGRRLLGREQRFLPDPGAAVLDMTAEFPATVRGGAYRCLPVLDVTAPTAEQLRAAADWIAAQRADGRAVYVHCAMGHGRSATAVAAWMMRQEPGLTVEAAEARMKERRPGVRLSGPQRRALGGARR